MAHNSFLSMIAAGLLACGGAAQAAEVTVHVAHLSPSQIRAKVVQAANQVCAQVTAADWFQDYASQPQCVADTVADTMAKLSGNTAAFQVAGR